jgi:hypothetical protein
MSNDQPPFQKLGIIKEKRVTEDRSILSSSSSSIQFNNLMIRKKKFGLENSFQAQNNYQPTYPETPMEEAQNMDFVETENIRQGEEKRSY